MITTLIYLVIYIIVLGLVLWLLNYLIDAVPLQEPFRRVAKTAIVVIGVLIIILLLLNFIGVIDGGFPRPIRP
jgi:cytochrome c biogenesis protein CcdA